jgi:hypothetical protein
MAATVRGERQDGGVGAPPFDLGATSVARPRSRLPEVLVGTLLVALFALAGAWFYSTSTTRVAYVALRQDLARGQVVERSDLTVYQLTTDAPLLAVPAADAGRLVGQVALADLASGTLVTAGQFSAVASIPPGRGVVGLDLGPGEFPTFAIRPGDTVRVLAIPADGRAGGVQAPEVLADRAEVVEVSEVGGRGRFIALVLDAEVADRVAVASARDQVRLIQVGGS